MAAGGVPAAAKRRLGAGLEAAEAAETIFGGGESGGDDFRRRRLAVTRARRRNIERSVRLHPDSDCGVVGGYGFVSTRGIRWWLFMREILNG
ncbi:hypothetical protein DY000_02049690 [Brassica cretica]|uniref:Uncharacterized protein n=1 Tax=Brassica cretica TaxID=69181 RepID=A0ABQ7F564_BRACR|nr:hypothetical protein DY000_02049690 [Brassica cretica]